MKITYNVIAFSCAILPALYALIAKAQTPTLCCPAGFVLQTKNGNAETVIVEARFSAQALGTLANAGTNASGVSARAQSGVNSNLTLELEDIVPENADITISIARDNVNGIVNIEGSFDGNTFVSLGAFGAGIEDILQRITRTSPTGGMRFIRFLRTQGRVWIDGVSYTDACLLPAVMTATKTVVVYDPTGSGDSYALPGNDVVYKITATNTGGSPVSAESIVLIDDLPPETIFFNGDMDGSGPALSPIHFTQSTDAGLDFVDTRDVRFGLGPMKPAGFSNCTIVAPDSTYRPDIQFICITQKVR